jgi:3-oxoacyl-[acyl-carrier protein] reductase
MDLQGKLVVVTGAGKGIGRAIAAAFAARGADLALLDLDAADLVASKALCEAQGTTVRTYLCNVAQEEQVIAALDAVVGDSGRLDVLVNNAGITRDALLLKFKDGQVTGKMSLQQWQAVLDVNLTGVFLCGREAAERMARLGRGGVIVNISSISRHGNAGQSNYSAAKAGVAALAVVWARELARYKIRAAAIAPGFIRTDILSAMKPEVLQKVIAPVPAGRLGEAAEIAQAAVFIAENEYFNGRVLEVDGGLRL